LKNNLVDFPPEYEEMIDKLESQITELFSEIHYYQALLTEKENTIIRLTTENMYLKAQVQTVSSKLTPVPAPPQQASQSPQPIRESYIPLTPPQQLQNPSYRDTESYTPPPAPPQQLKHLKPPSQESYASSIPDPLTEPPKPPSEDTRINKRVCPRCGAMGFAIKEVDDRTRVISYNPQRIYAKKKSCTKCRHEWH
jgi:hypothetical protein